MHLPRRRVELVFSARTRSSFGKVLSEVNKKDIYQRDQRRDIATSGYPIDEEADSLRLLHCPLASFIAA